MFKPVFLKPNERVVSVVQNNLNKVYNIGKEGERGVVRQVVTDVFGKEIKPATEKAKVFSSIIFILFCAMC